MKHEDIDKLEAGRELDALIAEKVMGLFDAELGPKPRNYGRMPLCDKCATDTVNCQVPHYSTDISAAWQVKEEIVKKGLGQQFADCYINETPWHWVFLKSEYFCLHICRAALKALPQQEKPQPDSSRQLTELFHNRLTNRGKQLLTQQAVDDLEQEKGAND